MNFLYTSSDADAHIDPYDQGQTFLANVTYLHLAALRGFGHAAERCNIQNYHTHITS